jgi:hypothetical protein
MRILAGSEHTLAAGVCAAKGLRLLYSIPENKPKQMCLIGAFLCNIPCERKTMLVINLNTHVNVNRLKRQAIDGSK